MRMEVPTVSETFDDKDGKNPDPIKGPANDPT